MASKTVIRPIASGKHVLKFLTNRNIFYDMHLSYGVCRLRARVHLKTLSSLLKEARKGFFVDVVCAKRLKITKKDI